jgi:predicted RecB family nuclease
MTPRLSKSRFVTGWQCPKLLWWKVHEPGADELVPGIVEQDRFDQGAMVGRLAQAEFPGGVLIDLPHNAYEARAEATRTAIRQGASAIYEATFIEKGMYVAVDVLLRDGDGWIVIEAKSSSKQKDEHIPDAAIQAWVVAAAGLTVHRVEIMHLSKDYRRAQAGSLFERTDVTRQVMGFLPQVAGMVGEFQQVLAGPLPTVAIGEQCGRPRDCPFLKRCWPADRDHIKHLFGVGFKKAQSYMQTGVHRIGDIPPTQHLGDTQRRQVRALVADTMVVESGLAAALASVRVDRLGFLDFEAINRAVPVWDGQKPWEQTPAQFSYHERQRDGSYAHREYLAEGPDDPREEITQLLLDATSQADRVVVYSAYEKSRINALAGVLPQHAADLTALADKLVDVLPTVRNHVYHPEFRGSFSIKDVLNPLCPDLSYDDLVIVDGMRASVEIARLLFFEHLVDDREGTRRNLLEYCKRDTWATVRLVERLEQLAG